MRARVVDGLFFWWLLIPIVLWVVFGVAWLGAWLGQKDTRTYRTACEQDGGMALESARGYVCADSAIIIAR